MDTDCTGTESSAQCNATLSTLNSCAPEVSLEFSLGSTIIKIAQSFPTVDSYDLIDKWLLTDMNTEIKYNIDNKCQNMVFNNYGTLFYYACVIDNSELLAYIINYAQMNKIHIDINYQNKDLNNDSCILHVVKFGYIDCLNILLTVETINYYITNEHISFTLGQTVTLKDAGKQNILFIALENNNYDCLAILFSKLDRDIIKILLTQKNFYGETFIQVLSKKYTIFVSYKKNAKLLAELQEFTTKYFPQLQLTIIDDYITLHKTQHAELQKINNTSTIDSELIDIVSLPLFNKIKTFDITPDYDILTPYVFKLHSMFPTEYCQELLTAFRDYKKYAVSNGYPIYIRHDNNMSALDKCGFKCIIDKFVDLVNKFLKANNITNITQQCSACFLIENFVGVEKEFAIHKDDSNFTFNLCLEQSEDLTGSEVDFYDDNGIHEYKYKHELGTLMIHPGNKLHKANNIKTGKRSSLIIWIKTMI